MSTTLLNKDTVTRKWYVLDAAGKPMGKTAALAADLLRGKLAKFSLDALVNIAAAAHLEIEIRMKEPA